LVGVSYLPTIKPCLFPDASSSYIVRLKTPRLVALALVTDLAAGALALSVGGTVFKVRNLLPRTDIRNATARSCGLFVI
jgi:hypothetical protein